MTARIVIVGAGFSGAVIARELAEAGIATILLRTNELKKTIKTNKTNDDGVWVVQIYEEKSVEKKAAAKKAPAKKVAKKSGVKKKAPAKKVAKKSAVKSIPVKKAAGKPFPSNRSGCCIGWGQCRVGRRGGNS